MCEERGKGEERVSEEGREERTNVNVCMERILFVWLKEVEVVQGGGEVWRLCESRGERENECLCN